MSKLVPNSGNDVVYTPQKLAKRCVELCNLRNTDVVLDPCKGQGSFLDEIEKITKLTYWCEIDNGVDFFQHTKKVDWIISNPPWSKFREFLKHSMTLSNNIGFLVTYNHFITKARIRDMISSGFWLTDVYLFETPKEFPQSGFQLVFGIVKKTDIIETKFHIEEK
jgi:type I restriction-modification system DNA methylase subunit